jgi:hypothetical protein
MMDGTRHEDVRLTLPRPMAEAMLQTLEYLPLGYNDRGRLANQFYDLLLVALSSTAGGCQGCEEAKLKAAALELERANLQARLDLLRKTDGE